jgi:hypothetical protein
MAHADVVDSDRDAASQRYMLRSVLLLAALMFPLMGQAPAKKPGPTGQPTFRFGPTDYRPDGITIQSGESARRSTLRLRPDLSPAILGARVHNARHVPISLPRTRAGPHDRRGRGSVDYVRPAVRWCRRRSAWRRWEYRSCTPDIFSKWDRVALRHVASARRRHSSVQR